MGDVMNLSTPGGGEMFRKVIVRGLLAATMLFIANAAMADNFGTGGNEFTIDFVTISGATNPFDTSPSGGYGIVNNDYRMGTCEITNDQWNKFAVAYGTVTGNPSTAYSLGPYNSGVNVPTDRVSWYEAAQFVNWLNTSTGHQAAYKFTGTQGTSDYTFATWSAAEADHGANLYRHKDAFYYLPTENEWIKAAYWNGTALQDYATKAGDAVFQGNGTNGGWNYNDGDVGPDGPAESPWDVGSGSEELNGTYDMMGNVWEWMESPSIYADYGASSRRGLRGGGWHQSIPGVAGLRVSYRTNESPELGWDFLSIGFRVASIPEPSSIFLLATALLGLLAYAWRRGK
jgi:formylglycine-generating enzyme required for sulfatase activity